MGEDFSIDGMRYTIVGVLGERTSLVYSGGRMATVYIPFTSYTRQYPQSGSAISEFYVTAPEGTKMADVEAVVNDFLYDFFGSSDGYWVYSMDVMEDAMGSVTNILKILLGGIASISLIVGGIGIMNIMLVTVTERTQEIGLKKAIGARRRRILNQFLTEAAVLTSLGGLLGVIVGIVMARLISSVMGTPTAISVPAILIAVVFSMGIGIVFGLLPAVKASNLNPIQALRRD